VAAEAAEALFGVATEAAASRGGEDIGAGASGSAGQDGGSAGSAPATTTILHSITVTTVRAGAIAAL
jgi:hypothetical protein